jgi:NNP family nitrate/nitrite transporter-like MFS transporter
VFVIIAFVLLVLSIPGGSFMADGPPGSGPAPLASNFRLGLVPFSILLFVLGCAMGIGKASVYKYIPDYFPNDVGAVGGVVGMLGALGGFILPPLFGFLGRWSGIPQLAFAVLLGLAIWSLAWLHLVVVRLRGTQTMDGSDLRLSPEYSTAFELQRDESGVQ